MPPRSIPPPRFPRSASAPRFPAVRDETAPPIDGAIRVRPGKRAGAKVYEIEVESEPEPRGGKRLMTQPGLGGPAPTDRPAPPARPDPEEVTAVAEAPEPEAFDGDHTITGVNPAMLFPSAPRVPKFADVSESFEQIDARTDEVAAIDDLSLDGPTQTRPAIVLPPPSSASSASSASGVTEEKPPETWVQSAESLLAAIERTPDLARRMALHRDLAALLREHDDPNQAFEVLVAALSEDVADDETVRALEAITHEHDRLGDLLRTVLAWSEDIEWMRDPPRLGALLLRIAKWYGEDVSKVEWGMPFVERARLLMDERDPRPYQLLARLHRRAERWGDAERAIEAALERAPSRAMRAELHVERGNLREARGDPRERVREAYLAAFVADASSESAIAALDALYAETGHHAQRVAAWERHVAAVRAPATLEAARLELVELLQHGGQEARAARVLEDVIASDPEHGKALKTLVAMRRKLGDSVGLRRTLERAIEVAKTPRDRVELLLELATLLSEVFLDHDAAVGALEVVVDLDATSEAAHAALVRIHRSRGRLHDLAQVLERHALSTIDRETRAAKLIEAARVLGEDLGETDRAITLAEHASELCPDSPDALELLGRLHHERGDSRRADGVFARALKHAVDPTQRAELLLRRAHAREAQGAKATEVRDLLHEALDNDPAHLGALEALRVLAHGAGDPGEIARAIVRELEATTAPSRRVSLLLELADLRAKQLGDHAGAIECWDEALYIAPASLQAASGLIEPYAEQGRWAEVHTLASLLLSSGTNKPSDRIARARWHALHGRALQALGRSAEASSSLAEAVRLDAGDVHALEALAETHFAAEDWDAAFAADQKLLLRLDATEQLRLLAVHHRMGRVLQEQGKARVALGSYRQALAIDPEHRPTIARLAEVYAERKAWPEVVDCKRRLLDTEKSDDARCKLLVEIAEVWIHQAKNFDGAVEALEEAVELKPLDRVLLHRLLEAYQRVEAWPQVAAVLVRITDADDNPQRRARYFYTLAQIRHEKADDDVGAIEAFEQALDEDPTMLKAFEAINRLHTERKAWKPLERSYRRMLHRLTGRAAEALELELWTGLGLLYRDRLNDDDSATEAFRMASRARPDDARVRRILAELHERSGRTEDAAAELHTAIERHPLHAEPYRALFRLYRDTGQVDRAWCLAAALVLLEKADDDIRLFHAQHRPRETPTFRGRLDPATFTRDICHADQDVLVGRIFELMLPAVRASRRATLRASIAPPADLAWQDPATTRVPIARAVYGAADVLAISAPRLAIREDRDGFLTPVATEPPSAVAGRHALSLTRPEDMLFVVGQHLSTWRGDAHLRVLFPQTHAQEALLLAGLKLGKPDLALPAATEARAIEDARTLAQYLEPVQLEALRLVVKLFVKDGGQADLKAFARGLELTAARAGLLLCGDSPTALRGFDHTRLSAVGIPASEVVHDLVTWFVSTHHLELRARLGIGVDRARVLPHVS